MIRHIVLFKLSDELSTSEKHEQINTIKKRFEPLSEEIEGLVCLRVEININPKEEFDFALIADLEGEEYIEKYAQHPAHKGLVAELIAPHLAKRACVDYVFRE